ncbi:MAG: class I SAM-dependent methyltransferase [Pseudomonadota bacterium]
MSNEEQKAYWNGKAGDTWTDAQERMDAMLAPISAAVLEFAAPQAGERVIDVGCGCGETSLAMAARGAAVWGVDISERMLARAQERAAGLAEVAFSLSDAATQDYTADHDLIFSRFGVMFFADPTAAFANLRTGLTPDGRMAFVCWQAPRDNPWVSVGGRIVQPYLAEPETPPDPRAPGPFAFADADYLRAILTDAGFASVEIEPLGCELRLGADVEEALDMQAQVGPIARALAELDDEDLASVRAELGAELAQAQREDGIYLAAACWLVRAR